MGSKATLVLGASAKHERYSNLCVRRLIQHGHPVIAVGRRAGVIGALPIITDIPTGSSIHTVTMYMNEDNQRMWEERILALRPRRIIFNPGAENRKLTERAILQGIEAIDACTLVMLSTGEYDR